MRERKLQKAREAYQRPGYRNFVLGLLTIVYVFNFLDRQVVNIWCATHYFLATRTLREDLARAPA